MRPPDNAHPRLIIRVPAGWVDAAEGKPGLEETAAVLYITALDLNGKSTGAPAMVNPM
jgi:precorrin isomerase